MRLRLTPYARLCLSFAVVIGLGWGLLTLPCMAAREPVGWLDGLFTSVSAVCVTGLSTRSVGNDFTGLGQAVILCLIQVGGLGFMTLSSSLLMRLRHKVTLGQAAVIRESLGSPVHEDLADLLLRCLRTVAVVEGVGALILFGRFSVDVPAGETWSAHAPAAAWQAVFHSVSAFCNAGLGLWDDSLARYSGDWLVNLTICGLIVLGGLGFFVLADVEGWFRAKWRVREYRPRYQTYVVLLMSFGLIITGATLLWLADHSNMATLAGRSAFQQIMTSAFHSISARTAGFSTVDIAKFTNASLGVLIVLMFIGASPGSTGGGVKTTTFAVILTMATGAWRPNRDPSFRYRSFGPATVRSAIALFFAAATLVLIASMFLMFIEERGSPFAQTGGMFVAMVFETTSAFGTVGLSTGITPGLAVASKLCLILLMYVGRVGPLGLMSLSLRGGARSWVKYPYEDVQIG